MKLILISLQKAAFKKIIGKRLKFRRKKKGKQKSENRAKKALKTISIILGAFVACWTPYHILAIIAGFCPTCINVHIYMFSYFVCYLNSPINPFCYAASNQQFMNAFKRIMRGDLSMKWTKESFWNSGSENNIELAFWNLKLESNKKKWAKNFNDDVSFLWIWNKGHSDYGKEHLKYYQNILSPISINKLYSIFRLKIAVENDNISLMLASQIPTLIQTHKMWFSSFFACQAGVFFKSFIANLYLKELEDL